MKTLTCIITAGLLLGAAGAAAEENFYRVYRNAPPLAGWGGPALWTTHVAQSEVTERMFDVARSRDGLWAHSAEFEFGVADRLGISLYADLIDPVQGSAHFALGRVAARYQFAPAHTHFVDTGVYVEFAMPRSGYPGSQHLEFRAILQKDLEDFRLVLNPLLVFDTHGRHAGGSPEVGLDAGVYYRRSRVLQPGLEFYADFGRSGAWKDQRYVLMPVVDVLIGRHWTWHLGAGRRVSGRGDAWIVESVLRLEFGAVRPRRWFGGP